MNNFEEFSNKKEFSASPDSKKIKMQKNPIQNDQTMNIMLHSFNNLKNDSLMNNSQVTRITSEGMGNNSQIKTNKNLRFMEFSQLKNESFGPIQNIENQEKKEKSLNFDLEQTTNNLTIHEIEKKMEETDYKGRPIEQESEVTSENSVDEDELNKEKNKNPFLCSSPDKIKVPKTTIKSFILKTISRIKFFIFF